MERGGENDSNRRCTPKTLTSSMRSVPIGTGGTKIASQVQGSCALYTSQTQLVAGGYICDGEQFVSRAVSLGRDADVAPPAELVDDLVRGNSGGRDDARQGSLCWGERLAIGESGAERRREIRAWSNIAPLAPGLSSFRNSTVLGSPTRRATSPSRSRASIST